MGDEKVNILVVDDVPEKLLTLQAILDELGENVVAASSGREALRQLLDRDFAVILLDVNMPEMDGLETASLIRQRERSRHVPIIFITAYDDDARQWQGYSRGAVDYIMAPINPDVLRTKVRVFVDLFKTTQQVKRLADERVSLAREQVARAAAEAETRRISFLATASSLLAESLDFDATLDAVATIVLPVFADELTLAFFESRAEPKRVSEAFQFAAPGTVPRRRHLTSPELPPDLLSALAAAGGDENLPASAAAAAAADLAGPGAAPQFLPTMLFPLHARGRQLGLLLLRSDRRRTRPAAAERALVEDLAGRAAIAIDNSLLYRAIQEHDHRKDEFLAMLGHELRNPLGAISNALQCLSLGAEGARPTDEAIEVLQRQVQRMTRMVDDLLDVSRITRGKISLRNARVDLSAIVRNVLASNESQLATRQLAVTVSLPREPVWLVADAARLEQVAANLLSNSAKYTEPGGRVWVAVTVQQDEVALSVRDSGVGIAPRVLPRIFDLFAQGDCSLDRSEGGLGIGLTLVKQLVEMHGGSVEAASPGLHQGSTFTVRLPLAQAAPSAEPAAAPSAGEIPTAAAGRRVLVVEDNPDVAATTAAVLRRIGHDVQVVNDGPAALATVLSCQLDAVLIDIGLPGMNGYEVARRVRESVDPAHPLLVAISGYGQKEDVDRSRAAGFDHHLVKPVEFRSLQQILLSAT